MYVIVPSVTLKDIRNAESSLVDNNNLNVASVMLGRPERINKSIIDWYFNLTHCLLCMYNFYRVLSSMFDLHYVHLV